MNTGPARDRDVADIRAVVSLFAAEFPVYDFGTQRTSRGISFVAVHRGGASQSGVYVVITPDPAEMRDALSP
jgi:hypothetical protein